MKSMYFMLGEMFVWAGKDIEAACTFLFSYPPAQNLKMGNWYANLYMWQLLSAQNSPMMKIRLLISTEDICWGFFNWTLNTPVGIRDSHQESEKWNIKSHNMMKFISDFLIFFSSSMYFFFPLFTLLGIHMSHSENCNPLNAKHRWLTAMLCSQTPKSSMWDKSLDAFHIYGQWLWSIYLLLVLKNLIICQFLYNGAFFTTI